MLLPDLSPNLWTLIPPKNMFLLASLNTELLANQLQDSHNTLLSSQPWMISTYTLPPPSIQLQDSLNTLVSSSRLV